MADEQSGGGESLQVEPGFVPSSDPQPVSDPKAPTPVPPNEGLTPTWLSGFESEHGKVAEKFVRESPEATLAEITKAYAGLETKLGQQSATEPAPEPVEAPKVGALSQAVADAGLDTAALVEQYQQSGGLTDEQYAKLSDKGWSKEAVNEAADGLAAKATQAKQAEQAHIARAFEVAGGEDGYGRIKDYVASKFSDSERAAYNEAVGGNAAQMEMAIRAAKARMAEDGGWSASRSLVSGEPGASADSQGFASDGEFHAWLAKNPDYHKDPAKLKLVTERLGGSSIIRS